MNAGRTEPTPESASTPRTNATSMVTAPTAQKRVEAARISAGTDACAVALTGFDEGGEAIRDHLGRCLTNRFKLRAGAWDALALVHDNVSGQTRRPPARPAGPGASNPGQAAPARACRR